MAFVETERIKHTIMLREGKTSLWSYFSHCSAMCVLIALAVCQGPLLYDYTLIYKVITRLKEEFFEFEYLRYKYLH